MTQEQYERWKDFAYRMARVCYAGNKEPSSEEIVGQLDDVFGDTGELQYEYAPGVKAWSLVVDWDHSELFGGRQADLVCDLVSGWGEHWNPHYWRSLDSEEEREGPEDDRPLFEDSDDQWCGPASACLRAGLDLASSPSMGVLGFTAGDVRRMYPEGVPQWVKDRFEGCETVTAEQVIPGVGFVPKVVATGGTFDGMADEDNIWL